MCKTKRRLRARPGRGLEWTRKSVSSSGVGGLRALKVKLNDKNLFSGGRGIEGLKEQAATSLCSSRDRPD